MYSFVREPKWIAGHVLTLLLLVAFICAGVWQFGRHQERTQRNETILDRSNSALLDEGDLFGPDRDIEFRLVQLTGSWASGDAVLIRNRSHQEVAGCHLVVPLLHDLSRATLITVGWLPQNSCSVNKFQPPLGSVSLTGRVRLSQERGSLGARDAATGVLSSLARTDVGRIDQQVPYPLAPVYVELINSEPVVVDAFPVDSPPTHLGPHLGYAVQWFLFFGVGIIGYPLVLRRHARKGTAENLGPDTY